MGLKPAVQAGVHRGKVFWAEGTARAQALSTLGEACAAGAQCPGAAPMGQRPVERDVFILYGQSAAAGAPHMRTNARPEFL